MKNYENIENLDFRALVESAIKVLAEEKTNERLFGKVSKLFNIDCNTAMDLCEFFGKNPGVSEESWLNVVKSWRKERIY